VKLTSETFSATAKRRDKRLTNEYRSGVSLKTLAAKYFGSAEKISQVLYVLGKEGADLRVDDRIDEWQDLNREDSASFSLQLPGWLLVELGFDPENNEFQGKWEVDEESQLRGRLLFLIKRVEAESEESASVKEEETAEERCTKCHWEGAFMQLQRESDGWHCPKCGSLVEVK
jgi:DNA-directed RNA polymerase subunit RPC12/RpoP